MSQPMTHPAPYAPAPAPKPRSSVGRIVSLVVSAVVVLGGIATAALFLLGGKAVIDEDKVQAEIVRITQQSAGIAPTDVHCPASVPIHMGDVTTCTAQLDGQPISYTVRQEDDKGNVHIESALIVSVDKVEKSLADRVQQNTGTAVEADCADGKQVVVGHQGTTIACTVTNTADPSDTAPFTATVTDDEGNIDFS